ncbi:MAG: hypothetical protein ACR2HX_00600 [Pyrinomonadaceae bacterium]
MITEVPELNELADLTVLAYGSSSETLLATRLEAQGWRAWYATIFGQQFVDSLDSAETNHRHHSEAIEWHWESRRALLRGERPPNDYFAYFPIWARGNLKTTVARRIMLCDACLSATAGMGGYALIVGGTKKKVGRTASSIESLLHSPALREYYPGLSEVKRGVLGSSKGWRADFLNTKAGYVFDFAGLDQGMAGANEEDVRPTFIVPDDIDQRIDSPAIAETNFNTFTTEILPMRQGNTLVFFAQNLISRFSVMYRIQTQRERVLTNRKPTTPVPAVVGLKTEFRVVNGMGMDIYLSGKVTWRGWDPQRVQDEINTSGLPAFLRECQHEVETDKQGRVIPEYEDVPGRRTHVITWTQFEKKYGARRIPAHWQCESGLDIGYTPEHLTAWTFVATSAANSALPGKKFRYRGLTYTVPLLDDMAEDVKKMFWLGERIGRERISHEKKGERMTLNQKHGFNFQSCKSGKTDGLPQWRHYLNCDKTRPHPFHEDTLLPDGMYSMGEPSWFDVVDDDQLETPRDDRGLKVHREQVVSWLYAPTPLRDSGMREALPVKAFEDTNDSTRMITAEWGPGATPLTSKELQEFNLPRNLHEDVIPSLPGAEQGQAVHARMHWLHEAEMEQRKDEENEYFYLDW